MNNVPVFPRLISAVRRQWLIVAVVVSVGLLFAVTVKMKSPAHYTATTSVLMVVGSKAATTDQESTTLSKPLLSTDLPALATSTTVLGRVAADLNESVPLQTIRGRVQAKIGSDSTIMKIDYTSRTPESAIDGANDLGLEITKLYRQLATARFDSLISDLNSQLDSRRSELTRLDERLADVSTTYPYIDVKSQGSFDSAQSVFQRLIILQAARDESKATVAADATAVHASEKMIENITPLAERDLQQSDPVYSKQMEQYSRDVADLRRLSSHGSDNYPGLDELRHTVKREQQNVQDARSHLLRAGLKGDPSYAAALDANTKAQGQLESDIARARAQVQIFASLQSQIGSSGVATYAARLRRDHDNAEAAYTIIAGRLAQSIADRAEAASTGSVIVLDRAQFASRSSVGSGAIAAGAIMFLAIWLAITAAFMIDGSYETFRENPTVERIYRAPVIGNVT
jgi:capsular polysaccharide biosynthesis protein